MTETKEQSRATRIIPLIILVLVFGVTIGFFILQLYRLLHPTLIE